MKLGATYKVNGNQFVADFDSVEEFEEFLDECWYDLTGKFEVTDRGCEYAPFSGGLIIFPDYEMFEAFAQTR